jgi:NDP-sugar pyrophosphorylase family protein
MYSVWGWEGFVHRRVSMDDSLAPMASDATASKGAGPATELAAVVLAAGAGTRLRPLTRLRPKPLCPVGGVALLDHALRRVADLTEAVAVNVHHRRHQLEEHLARREASGGSSVQVSVEEPEVLGTAGAVGQLRWWLDGRATLVVNADTFTSADLAAVIDGWDGERVRLLVHGADRFGPRARVVASLLPWSEVAALEARPSGLYEVCWGPADAQGRLEAVRVDGAFFDCGTPASYLAANRHLAAGSSIVAPDAVVPGVVQRSVVGAGAAVAGAVVDSVVWDGAVVGSAERLVSAVRADRGVTVLVR